LLQEGVIFTNAHEKGPVLDRFLSRYVFNQHLQQQQHAAASSTIKESNLPALPREIVFIDDRFSNARSVYTLPCANRLSMQVVCYHYCPPTLHYEYTKKESLRDWRRQQRHLDSTSESQETTSASQKKRKTTASKMEQGNESGEAAIDGNESADEEENADHFDLGSSSDEHSHTSDDNHSDIELFKIQHHLGDGSLASIVGLDAELNTLPTPEDHDHYSFDLDPLADYDDEGQLVDPKANKDLSSSTKKPTATPNKKEKDKEEKDKERFDLQVVQCQIHHFLTQEQILDDHQIRIFYRQHLAQTKQRPQNISI